MTCISKLGFWRKIQGPQCDPKKKKSAIAIFFKIAQKLVLDPKNSQHAARPPPLPRFGVRTSAAVGGTVQYGPRAA